MMPYCRLVLQGHKMSPTPQEGSALWGRWLRETRGETHFPARSPCAQKTLQFKVGSGQTRPKGKILAGKWGMSLPSMVIPHSISFTLFYLPESTWIQITVLCAWWLEREGGTRPWGLLQAEEFIPRAGRALAGPRTQPHGSG